MFISIWHIIISPFTIPCKFTYQRRKQYIRNKCVNWWWKNIAVQFALSAGISDYSSSYSYILLTENLCEFLYFLGFVLKHLLQCCSRRQRNLVICLEQDLFGLLLIMRGYKSWHFLNYTSWVTLAHRGCLAYGKSHYLTLL